MGGGVSGYKNKSETASQEYTNSSFAIHPAIGVAVKDNAVVGLRIAYAHGKTEQLNGTYTNVQEQNIFSPGLFYRRYASLGRKFYLFGEGGAYYSHGKTTNETKSLEAKSTQTSNTVGINFYPGVAFAVNRKIHLEVGLNNLLDFSYSSGKIESVSSGTTNTTKTSGFAFSTNVSTTAPLSVGFRFVLGK